MNELPGISTCSSCGGHAQKTNTSQAAEGRFYVMFAVTGVRGLKSLELLAGACSVFSPEPKLTAADFGDPGTPSLGFTVQGRIAPDLLAQEIMRRRQNQ